MMDVASNLIFDHITVNAELRTLLPDLSDKEYGLLRESIEENGYDASRGGKIVLWKVSGEADGDGPEEEPQYFIIDGHHRWEIVTRLLEESGETKYFLNDDCFTIMDFADIDEAKSWIIGNQLERRNLSSYGRFEVFYRNIEILRAQGRKNMSAAGKGLSTLTKVDTRKELANCCGVSDGTVRKFMKIADSEFDDLKEDLRHSRKTAEEAYKIWQSRTSDNMEENGGEEKEAGGTKKRRSQDEKTQELEELRKIVEEQRQKIEDQAREIKDLKTMIAEKEQEIQRLKDKLDVADLEKVDTASENLRVPA